jgi:hypothetical protein
MRNRRSFESCTKSIDHRAFGFASTRIGVRAAEQLVIAALDPARALTLVGEIRHEDRKARHQPRRQPWISGLVPIDRTGRSSRKAPVDRPAKLRQRMIQVDDLVEQLCRRAQGKGKRQHAFRTSRTASSGGILRRKTDLIH